jgi:plasmid stabilization system protein ParE
MSYIVKALARADLKRHWRYIARDNVDAADRLLAAAADTFCFITANADLGS